MTVSNEGVEVEAREFHRRQRTRDRAQEPPTRLVGDPHRSLPPTGLRVSVQDPRIEDGTPAATRLPPTSNETLTECPRLTGQLRLTPPRRADRFLGLLRWA